MSKGVIGVMCFLAGGVFGYAVCRYRYEKILDEGIDAAIAEYEKQQVVINPPKENDQNEPQNEAVLAENEPKITKIMPDFGQNEAKNEVKNIINYQKYASLGKEAEESMKAKGSLTDLKKLAEERMAEEPDETYDEYSPSEGYSDDPYVLTPKEFSETEFGNDKVTLIYYAKDDVLAYERSGEPVDDIAGTVGEDFVSHIGEFETDVAYFRCERFSTDFEVIKEDMYYEEE